MEKVAVMNQKVGMENVEQLLKILLVVNKLHEEQQINLLMNQISEMEQNYAAVMQELTDIKGQLNEALSKNVSDPVISQNKGAFQKLGEQIDVTIAARQQKLENIKQDLNQKAQTVVQKFKEIGIKALNKVCEFLGIQEKLVELRNHARSSEMDMKIRVEKIDMVEKELSGAASQIRNAGRIIAGKERVTDSSETPKGFSLLHMIKNHFLKRQEAYARRAEKLDHAIEKFRSLEEKASVLGKLAENKEQISEKEKSKEGDRAASKETEHRREEAVR